MLYYVHGYQSNPNSSKGILLKQKLNVNPIKYRECEPEKLIIPECIKNINNIIHKDKEPILIGSSLGGFLSAKIALDNKKIKKLILLNPAILPKDYDIKKIKDMPQRILIDMLEPRFFQEKIVAETLIIIGTEDNVVPNTWSIDFAKIQESTIKFLIDDHRFSKNIKKIPVIIEKFLSEKH